MLFFDLVNDHEQKNWFTYAEWLFANDPSATKLIIRSHQHQIVCRPDENRYASCFSAAATEFPEASNHALEWEALTESQQPAAFLRLSGQQNGIEIEITYNLNRILNEVPRFGLAPHSTLLLINEEGQVLGYPSDWGRVDLLDQFNDPKEELRGKTLQNSLPLPSAEFFSPENLQIYLQDQQPHIFSTKIREEKVYFALRKIEDTPVAVILMLPLTDIYGQAAFYGASLTRMDSIPAVTQAAISAVSFLLVIFFGALLSLRVIASPIKTLHEGASAIANNQLNTRVAESGLGEMKGLAIAFNQMANAIQISQGRLESKQLELKHTLTARVEELSAMNGIIAFTNTDVDLPQKLNGVIQVLCKTLEICNARILLYEPGGNLYQAAQFEGDCHPIAPQSDPIEIEIIFSKQQLGKLILNCAADHPLNPVHTDFLEALSTTIGVLIKNAELQSQVRSITISEERRHLARELHDSVTQTLFSVSLAAEGLKGTIGENRNPAVHRALTLLLDQLDRVRSEMRGLILELRPIELGSQNLEEAILGHAASLQRTTNIHIDTTIRGPIDNLPRDIQTALNRIVQESLSNIARHARADQVSICLAFCDSIARLKITDNGSGFDVNAASQRIGAYGLINIRERSELFGGQVTIQSEKNRGTTITVMIPIQEQIA